MSNNLIDLLPKQPLTDFCRRWRITELSLFGSILRDDFAPESDIDMLVTFADNARWTLLDHVQMEEELAAIVGRPVDLVSRRAVEQSPNWLRKARILDSAQPFIQLPAEDVTHAVA